MTPEQQIDSFANEGWVAPHVRYEPIGKLRGRFKVARSVALVLNVIFLTAVLLCIQFWITEGFISAGVTLATILLLMLFGSVAMVTGIAALQMSRFINLRKALAGKAGAAS